MTVIAFDGTVLAADRQATLHGHAVSVTKLTRRGDVWMVASGKPEHYLKVQAWFLSGADPAEYPSHPDDANIDMWVVNKSGETLRFEGGPYPLEVGAKKWASGCGGDYARAAMHLGHDAIMGCRVACALDIYCGEGIDWVNIKTGESGRAKLA